MGLGTRWKVRDFYPWVIIPGSLSLGPYPWVIIPGSLSLGPYPWVLIPGSLSLGPCPWVIIPGSLSLGPCPWVIIPGSLSLGPCPWVLVPNFFNLEKSYILPMLFGSDRYDSWKDFVYIHYHHLWSISRWPRSHQIFWWYHLYHLLI